MAGIYVGANIPRPIPGQFSYHIESRPPKGSEKPGQSSKKGLRTKLSDTPQILPPASIFQHAQSLHKTDHGTIRLGEDRTESTLLLRQRQAGVSGLQASLLPMTSVCRRRC